MVDNNNRQERYEDYMRRRSREEDNVKMSKERELLEKVMLEQCICGIWSEDLAKEIKDYFAQEEDTDVTITVTITQKEYAVFQRLKKIWGHSVPEMSGQYFICGEGVGGERDEMGLPEYISVCPAFGLDGFALYKKHKDYSAPGW